MVSNGWQWSWSWLIMTDNEWWWLMVSKKPTLVEQALKIMTNRGIWKHLWVKPADWWLQAPGFPASLFKLTSDDLDTGNHDESVRNCLMATLHGSGLNMHMLCCQMPCKWPDKSQHLQGKLLVFQVLMDSVLLRKTTRRTSLHCLMSPVGHEFYAWSHSHPACALTSRTNMITSKLNQDLQTHQLLTANLQHPSSFRLWPLGSDVPPWPAPNRSVGSPTSGKTSWNSGSSITWSNQRPFVDDIEWFKL